MLPDKNSLTPRDLSLYLPGGRLKSVVCLDSTDSTNTRLRALAAEDAEHGTVVLASAQTAGRGRLGRSFASPGGMGIYLSYLFRPSGAPAEAVVLTAAAAVAAARAIYGVCGFYPDIKWVNDLLYDGGKICGILSEAALNGNTAEYIIVGLGINVSESPEDFPSGLRTRAASLFTATGKYYSRAALAAQLIKELDKISSAGPRAFLDEYRAHCITIGKEIRIIAPGADGSGGTPAAAIGINDDFSLRVRYEDGKTVDIGSGEASVRGKDGYI